VYKHLMNHRRVTTSNSLFYLVCCFPTEHCSSVRDVIVYAINIRRDKGILFATPYKVKIAGLGRTGGMCRGLSEGTRWCTCMPSQSTIASSASQWNITGMCCVGTGLAFRYLQDRRVFLSRWYSLLTWSRNTTHMNQSVHSCLYISSTVNAPSE
jgi:hypothetical protein